MSKVVITGGAGFVGSNLCERYLNEGWHVTAVDNSITGTSRNLDSFMGRPAFDLVEADVSEPMEIDGPVDLVLHFASLASPVAFFQHQIETLKAGSMGTISTLDLALEKGARFVFSSSSEVYGDPEVYPQPESYWGNVNPVGPRSMYDESKRFSEAMVMSYHRAHGIDTRIVRLFNSYGPRMKIDDGRIVSEFIRKALLGEPLEVHGDGLQTRSMCYVSDTVDGIWRVSQGSDLSGGVFNVGNPDERTVLEVAELVVEFTGGKATIEHKPGRPEDPKRRCPDVTRLTQATGWAPGVDLRDGIKRTVDYYKSVLAG